MDPYTFCPHCGADAKPFMRGPGRIEWWCESSRTSRGPVMHSAACRWIQAHGGWYGTLAAQLEEE